MRYEEAIKNLNFIINHVTLCDTSPYEKELLSEEQKDACKIAIKALEKVADLEKRGFTDEVLDNYKTFEDECIAKGFTFKSLIEARERQIPKKPTLEYSDNVSKKVFGGVCECGTTLSMNNKNCPCCGQAIDWSDEE